MHDIRRRNFIKLALKSTTTVALGSIYTTLNAGSINDSQVDSNVGVADLAKVLRAMDNDVCNLAADNLDIAHGTNASLYLHLRSAGLNVSDAEILAEAMRKHSTASKYPLRSFSVSYNPGLGDSGVVTLAKSLPLDLYEIGLVGCNIQDKGCEAIIRWAAKAPELRMICIEGNNLTKEAKSRLNILEQTNPDLSVYS